jgi:hypothetical protein
MGGVPWYFWTLAAGAVGLGLGLAAGYFWGRRRIARMPVKEIRIFDVHNNVLAHAGIQFEMFNANTSVLVASDRSRDLNPPHGHWGVELQFTACSDPFDAYVTDSNYEYPGNTIRNLEGKQTDRIDIDLLKLPPSGGGQASKFALNGSAQSLSEWIESGYQWNKDEKRAVSNLAFNYLASPLPKGSENPVMSNWEGALRRLGFGGLDTRGIRSGQA